MYKISDYIEVKEFRNKYQLSYRKIFTIYKTKESSNLINALCTHGVPNNSKLAQSALFKILLKNHLIHNESYSRENNPRTVYYLENQYIDADKRLNLLKEKRICILGLGGIGAQILQYLCNMDIRNYVLIDYDKVEKTNLNRQFIYSYQDIGKNKTEVCEEYIKSHVLGKTSIKKIKLK